MSSTTTSQRITIEVKVPGGYKVIDFRPPVLGEEYIGANGGVRTCRFAHPPESNRLILEKIFVYREAVMPDDYGKTVEFADDSHGDWRQGVLGGFSSHPEVVYPWTGDDGDVYKFARIKV